MKYFQFLIFCLMPFLVKSQSASTLSGIIEDQSSKPVDLALISLFTTPDSTYIKSGYSDQDGSFSIDQIPNGIYHLHISLLGYKPHYESLEISNSIVNMTPIRLESDNQKLDEVTIKAKIPYIERKIDRTVITPDALISNAGSNALEVLERAPGLSVDVDGTISLKGRSGVAIFINDKPSYLSGGELENYLRSLPAGSIKSIEIMENPPAKYEAAGNSGVINILIKRSTLKGLYGNTSLSYRKSRYNNSNNSLNLNYNKDKVSLYSNIYAGFWENFQDLNINRFYRDEDNIQLSSFAQNSFNNRNGKYVNGKIGLDFYPSDKTTLGVSFKRSSSPGQRNTDNTALVSDAGGTLRQRVIADNESNTSFDNNLINAYITTNLDSLGSKISFDADLVNYDSGNDQIFKNLQYDDKDVLTYQDQINGEIPSNIKIYAAKTDYTKPFASGNRLELGLKTALTKTDNEAIYSNTIDGETSPDYNLSNRFLYDEWINAGYINYNTRIGKIDFQAGLRGEATKLEGNQLGNPERPDTSFTRNYNSLFPTFYAATNLDSSGHHNINFSYGRRIDRPYFQDLNPFISPLDRFTFYSGNPDLVPTFAHNLSLNHSYKGFLNTTLSYSKTLDAIQETLEIRENIYYSRPGNIASSQTLSLSMNGSFTITPWYRLNAYVEVANLSYNSDLYTEQLNSSGTYYFLSATNSFDLGRGWKADISGRYVSDVVVAQLVVLSYGVVNFGFQKSIMDGKGSIKLSVSDPLYTRRGSGIINNLRLTDADWNSKYDSRNASLTFSLRFGKSNSKKQKYNSSGSQEEQSRVKS